VILREVIQGKGPGYVLVNSGVEVIYIKACSVSQALNEILDKPTLKG
jgi:hypothetical protein